MLVSVDTGGAPPHAVLGLASSLQGTGVTQGLS